MAGGAFNVGDVETRVSFRYDGTDADRFERKESELRRKAAKPIEQKVGVDGADRGVRDLDKYDRKVRDVDDSHGKLARGSGRLRGAMGTLFIGGAGVAAGGIAFAGLAKGVMSATDAFQESEAISKQTGAVIKSTGGAANVTAKQVGDLATALSKKTGVDDEVIQSGENMLLTFTNVRNEVGKGNDIFNQATSTVTDMSVALGQDTKSSAIQLGKALNDPIKGVTALQRVGVTFTKQQKEQIATLVQHGDKVKAQKLILGELNKEFGGSAAAQNNWRKQLSVTWGNLQETIGGKLAPALQKAGTWVNGLLTDLMSGGKTASSFSRTISGVASTIRGVFAGAFRFVGTIIADNRGSIRSLGSTLGKLAQDVRRLLGGIGRVFSETFGSGSGTGRDIRQIVHVLLSFASTVAKVAEAVIHRALPGIITAFRGLAQIIRGVIKVIAGILTLDFGKAWDGVKDIFSGALKVIGGILRAGTAGLRTAAAALAHVVVDAVSGLPGSLAGIGRRAVSAFANALKGLPGAIGSALQGGGQFLGNIGRGIADWLNAHTPFGDKIKVGPIHVTLPALWRGGKVGPGAGGARVFIAGEGSKDEWVISQEGDRRKNVQWAREALETLTGRRVGLHKGGKGARAAKAKKKAPDPDSIVPTRRVPSMGALGGKDRGLRMYEERIQSYQRSLATLERGFDFTEETALVEHDDGSITVDSTAANQRITELDTVVSIGKKIAGEIKRYAAAIKRAAASYLSRYRKLVSLLKKTRRGKRRDRYKDELDTVYSRLVELGGEGAPAGQFTGGAYKDVLDQHTNAVMDYGEDVAERQGLKDYLGVKGGVVRAADPPTTDSAGTDAGGSEGAGDGSTGGDTGGGGDTGSATPTAADIAAAALADFASFNAARASLFSSFGGNFMSREGLAALLLGGASQTAQAAGLRAFGAMPTAGATINITNNFGGGPTSPQTWAQQQQFAVESAMG